MNQARSNDGTSIAWDRAGSGPALVIVDGAFCYRGFGPAPKLAPLLARHFTVYTYDRRGRGASGDTPLYAPEREIEDVAAMVDAAGGRASLLGLSSGGALALHAAASRLPIDTVIAYEPPYVDDAGTGSGAAHRDRLAQFIASGDRGGAVKYFMKDMVGAPGFVAVMMRLMPWVWNKLVAVAHTLPYDAAIMTDFRIPRARYAGIGVPVVIMNGGKTQPRLRNAARAIAGVIPGARYRELPGQTHNVSASVLSPAVVELAAS